jgi:spore maturation protein CgeB
VRPDTTGEHCLSALHELAEVAYFAPTRLGHIPSSGFDLYLHIDDGFHYTLPDVLRPSAWWVVDTHLTYDRDLEIAGTFEFVFAAQRDGADRLRADGIWPVWWLPLACNPKTHGRIEAAKDLDVTFVGNPGSPERQRLLDLIRSHFPNSFTGNAYGEDMARLYSRAKVVFNCGIRNDVNMRVFEALASGSLLVTNDLSANGQAALFQDGRHLVTYRTDEELLDRIAYYLAHEEEREAIARARL